MIAPLVLEDVSVTYGRRAALDRINVAFAAGRVTGLVGANGAGKTTLLRAALGLVPLSGAGTVRVLDRPRPQWSREGLARAMAYLPQGGEAHWPVEARKVVALGRFPHRAPFAPTDAEDLSAVDHALARCDALAFAGRRIDRLSAGERARVLLARALATESPILLADEPAAHLDPAHQLRLMELLREEARRDVAVVVTLHDLSLASRFCDDVLILAQGRILAGGNPETALSDENLAAAFAIRPLKLGEGDKMPVIPWQRI